MLASKKQTGLQAYFTKNYIKFVTVLITILVLKKIIDKWQSTTS